MSAHSAGPWTWGKARTVYTAQDAAGHEVCSVSVVRPRIYGAEGDAIHARSISAAGGNFPLIAAAPDLLAALRGLLDDSPYADPGDSGECECGRFDDSAERGDVPARCPHTVARAAIARAEGRS